MDKLDKLFARYDEAKARKRQACEEIQDAEDEAWREYRYLI
jgi:outer membrane protein TolC